MAQNNRQETGRQGASIYDVAEEANVSIVTVSRVFNDYPHVTERMRQRVFSAARTVGYTPRIVSKRNAIAVIVGHLDQLNAGDYKTDLIIHTVQAAARKEFLVEFIPFDSVDLATQHHVDGIIEIGLTGDEARSITDLPPVPVVLTNKESTRKKWHAVCSDHQDEAAMATELLVENGHTHIALVLDELTGWGPENRQEGFRAVIAERLGVHADPKTYSADKLQPADIARRILDDGCTAAMLFSDNAGMAVFDALVNDLGIRIPEDISIIGLENPSVSQFMHPRLTTIRQPLEEIAEAAVSHVVAKAQHKTSSSAKLFKSHLIRRDSVKKLS